jgi:hypothetical protein
MEIIARFTQMESWYRRQAGDMVYQKLSFICEPKTFGRKNGIRAAQTGISRSLSLILVDLLMLKE